MVQQRHDQIRPDISCTGQEFYIDIAEYARRCTVVLKVSWYKMVARGDVIRLVSGGVRIRWRVEPSESSAWSSSDTIRSERMFSAVLYWDNIYR